LCFLVTSLESTGVGSSSGEKAENKHIKVTKRKTDVGLRGRSSLIFTFFMMVVVD
jgi:hypothetical protein